VVVAGTGNYLWATLIMGSASVEPVKRAKYKTHAM